jgi:hypothetical protein
MAAKKRAGAGQKKVGKVMHEFKHGELHSGSKKGPKVKNPKQAIAIALSEARESGANIPPKKGAKKAAGKKTTAKKSAGKKAAAKKTGAKKTAAKKTARKG